MTKCVIGENIFFVNVNNQRNIRNNNEAQIIYYLKKNFEFIIYLKKQMMFTR